MTIETLAAPIVALVAGLAALGWLLRRGWRFVTLSVHAFETIQHELRPNSGSSTYDLVRTMKAQADVHEERLDQLGLMAGQAAGAAEAAVRDAQRAVSAASVATMAATQAAAEAQAARVTIGEMDIRNVAQMAKTQGAVEGLALAIASRGRHTDREG